MQGSVSQHEKFGDCENLLLYLRETTTATQYCLLKK